MSSRKPHVAQSTFGFPDDSSPERGLSSPQQTPSTQNSCPVQSSTFSLRPESSLIHVLSFPHPAWSNLATPKNVEKLSFQARLNCLYRQSENFYTTLKCNILPDPSGLMVRAAPCLPPLLSSRTLRHLLEAPSSLSSCLCELLGIQKNVEKLSFQARVFSILLQPENYLATPKFNIFPRSAAPPTTTPQHPPPKDFCHVSEQTSPSIRRWTRPPPSVK